MFCYAVNHAFGQYNNGNNYHAVITLPYSLNSKRIWFVNCDSICARCGNALHVALNFYLGSKEGKNVNYLKSRCAIAFE